LLGSPFSLDFDKNVHSRLKIDRKLRARPFGQKSNHNSVAYFAFIFTQENIFTGTVANPNPAVATSVMLLRRFLALTTLFGGRCRRNVEKYYKTYFIIIIIIITIL